MKNFKPNKAAKDLHEYHILYFLGLGCFAGFILGAFMISFLGGAALVFGISLGIFIGFSINVLVKN